MKDSDIRFTPKHVLDVVREFDNIVLDPCTSEGALTFAMVMIGPPRDGLAECWSGLIADSTDTGVTFVNCPYSRGQIIRWALKCHEEWERNSVESILLIPSDTSTRWSQFCFQHAQAVGFWDKRIAFLKADGSKDNGAKFGSAFWYWGERQGRFQRVFREHAEVLVLR